MLSDFVTDLGVMITLITRRYDCADNGIELRRYLLNLIAYDVIPI
jgi:hypothetical protein